MTQCLSNAAMTSLAEQMHPMNCLDTHCSTYAFCPIKNDFKICSVKSTQKNSIIILPQNIVHIPLSPQKSSISHTHPKCYSCSTENVADCQVIVNIPSILDCILSSSYYHRIGTDYCHCIIIISSIRRYDIRRHHHCPICCCTIIQLHSAARLLPWTWTTNRTLVRQQQHCCSHILIHR